MLHGDHMHGTTNARKGKGLLKMAGPVQCRCSQRLAHESITNRQPSTLAAVLRCYVDESSRGKRVARCAQIGYLCMLLVLNVKAKQFLTQQRICIACALSYLRRNRGNQEESTVIGLINLGDWGQDSAV